MLATLGPRPRPCLDTLLGSRRSLMVAGDQVAADEDVGADTGTAGETGNSTTPIPVTHSEIGSCARTVAGAHRLA